MRGLFLGWGFSKQLNEGGRNMGRSDQAATATKELISIVMALAATNIISQFVAIHAQRGDYSVPDRTDYALLGALLLFAVRFYHGNVLNIDYHLATDSKSHPVARGIAFFVVLSQSFILTFIPYFFRNLSDAMVLILLIFVADFLWLSQHFHTQAPASHEVTWSVLAGLGGFLFGAKFLFQMNEKWTIVLMLVVTSALDYAMNWSFYFPSITSTEIPAGVSR
jgi:hypothetical protein